MGGGPKANSGQDRKSLGIPNLEKGPPYAQSCPGAKEGEIDDEAEEGQREAADLEFTVGALSSPSPVISPLGPASRCLLPWQHAMGNRVGEEKAPLAIAYSSIQRSEH